MRLRTKILALMAVPVVMLAGTVAFAVGAERSTTESLRLVEHSYQVKDTLRVAFADLVDAETGMRGYLLSGSADLLAPYENGSARVTHDLDRLAFLVQDNPDQLQRLNDLGLLAPERLRILAQLRPYAPITETPHPERVDPILQDGQTVMEEIRSTVAIMTDEENRLLRIRQASLERARHVAFLVEVVALPLGVLIGLVSVFGFARRLARRLWRSNATRVGWRRVSRWKHLRTGRTRSGICRA